MRIRTIKPEFWESESLGRVSREARLLFIGLFNCCDDSGRTRGNSRMLASRLFPYDDDAIRKIDGWLRELACEQCIRLYQIDGCMYLDIPKWASHQKIDKPSQSKLPEFDESSRILDESSRKIALEQGTGNREGEGEQGSGIVGKNESAAAAAPTSEADWIDSLKKDPAFNGIDIATQHAKCARWCKENKKQNTRRRFINWLNRCDKPMGGTLGLEDRFNQF